MRRKLLLFILAFVLLLSGCTTSARIVEKEEENMDLVAQHSKSQWPLPIIGLDEDPEKVRLGNLVQAIGEVEIQPSDVSSQEGTPSPG